MVLAKSSLLIIQGSSVAELLNSQERGALVKHVLESARAEPGDEHALEPALTLRPGQSIGEYDQEKERERERTFFYHLCGGNVIKNI